MTQITEDTFEQVLHLFKESPGIDLKEASFIDPYGMVGILELGEFLQLKGSRKTIYLPESEEVLKYLERMDFFRFADSYFNLEPSKPKISGKYLRSSYSDVLLEITPIEKSDDIHFIVGRVKDRAHSILSKHLHYNEKTINGFIVALSEVCQNIIEHSRRFVNQWDGKISIRSGTAKLSIIPNWAWGKPKEISLTPFPGSQINIILLEM